MPGKDRVYVLSLEKHYDSFLPDFEIVEDDVMDVVKSQAVTNMLAERSFEIRDTLQAVLETGKSFKEAVAPLGWTVETTEEFDLSTGLDSEFADPLNAAGVNAEEGELCRPVPVEGGMLFAYVAQRASTDPSVGMAAVRDELVSGLTRVRARRLTSGWQDDLMDEADLQLNQ